MVHSIQSHFVMPEPQLISTFDFSVALMIRMHFVWAHEWAFGLLLLPMILLDCLFVTARRHFGTVLLFIAFQPNLNVIETFTNCYYYYHLLFIYYSKRFSLL